MAGDQVRFKGTGTGPGSVLQVTLQGPDIIEITGQVSGQSVNVKE
jgi:hypothetical protein